MSTGNPSDETIEILRTLRSGWIISLIAVVLIGLLNFLVRRTLAVNLSIVDYGYFYSIFSFLSLFIAVFDLGTGQAGVILIAHSKAKGDDTAAHGLFSALLLFRIVVGAIAAGAFAAVAAPLADTYFKVPEGTPTLVTMCAWMGIMIVLGTLLSVFEGVKNFTARNSVLLCYYGLAFVLITVGTQELTTLTAAGAFVGGGVVAFIVFLGYAGWRYGFRPSFDLQTGLDNLRKLWRCSRWIAVTTCGLLIMFNMDTIMLTWLTSLENVAEYNVALPIMQIFLSVLLVIPQVFIPLATELVHGEDISSLRRYALRLTLLIFALMGAACIGLYFEGARLISLLFTDHHSTASTALLLLGVSVPFYIAAQLHLGILNVMNREKTAAMVVLFGVGVNLISNAALIPLMDINGAAAATLLSYLVIFAASWHQFRSSSGDEENHQAATATGRENAE
jgi:O-antigen/teichoic acid export membrane protein